MTEDKKTPAPGTAENPVSKIEAEIELWFRDHFPNSVVSRAGTEVWNLVHEAKEALKLRLAKLL